MDPLEPRPVAETQGVRRPRRLNWDPIADRTAHLSFRDVTKRFGDNFALHGINFDVYPGEIHAVLGQNGAGKSTLAKITAGLYSPDRGEILLNGNPVRFKTPKDARSSGIGMMFQQLSLIAPLTVAENLHLDSPTRGLFLSNKGIITAPGIPPDQLVSNLSLGERQQIELTRLLRFGLELILLDEPTSSLSPEESSTLFERVKQLRSRGKTVILITHRLADVLQIADRVTVLRKGMNVGTKASEELDEDSLTAMLIGEQASPKSSLIASNPTNSSSKTLISLRSVSYWAREAKAHLLTDLTFDLRENEILGVAAVIGNGQRELFRILCGLTTPSSGNIYFRGKPFDYRRFGHEISYIPENVIDQGLVAPLPILENLSIGQLDEPGTQPQIILQRARLRERACTLMKDFEIDGTPDTLVEELSGGNQRKVVIARELSKNSSIVLAENPTAGLDIQAAQNVLRHLRQKREQGKAVFLLSYELGELLSTCDRVLVFSKGRVVASLEGDSLSYSALASLLAKGSLAS